MGGGRREKGEASFPLVHVDTSTLCPWARILPPSLATHTPAPAHKLPLTHTHTLTHTPPGAAIKDLGDHTLHPLASVSTEP